MVDRLWKESEYWTVNLREETLHFQLVYNQAPFYRIFILTTHGVRYLPLYSIISYQALLSIKIVIHVNRARGTELVELPLLG